MTVVVKLGTSLVAGPTGRVRRSVLRSRAREIGAVVRGGEAVAVVSSGAIALGLPYLGLDRRPRSVPRLQAASALGQARLQRAWEQALGHEGLQAAQILLTAEDVADRVAYVNARNALQALFALGAVPIVNENDATATEEIAFGDNDALAAQVALLVRARRGGRGRSSSATAPRSATRPSASRPAWAAAGCGARCWPRGWRRPAGYPP